MAASISLDHVPSSSSTNPEGYLSNNEIDAVRAALDRNDFRGAIQAAFHLPADDAFVYHATASVTLSQVQAAVDAGAAHGLCHWYPDDQLAHPSPEDVDAYLAALGSPTARSGAALADFAANAKKGSLRQTVAQHLLATRDVDPALGGPASKKKKKPPPQAALTPNPALFFWHWACRRLQWAGPLPLPPADAPARRPHLAHPVLPILMHHFGCAVPSPEALALLTRLAADARFPHGIVDCGSGTGYWTCLLRQAGAACMAVDSGQSAFRARWVGDTQRREGTAWLRAHGGGEGYVLLLVYPIVGGAFVRRMLDAYRGAAVAVAGVQDRSGYTAFADVTFEQYMEGDAARRAEGWRRVARLPLPSNAGKDEVLWIFLREGTGDGGTGEISDKQTASSA